MNQILSGKSVLLVARKLEDLGALRALFSQLGAGDVHVASSANMALNMLRMQPVDICVIEAQLGEHEKTGAQVLEEANMEGLRTVSSAFILITAAGDKIPTDSLENSADTFLVKPFDLAKIQLRLEKLMKLKRAVAPIESLVDAGDLKKALQVADLLLEKIPPLAIYINRLKGRLLLRMGLETEALQHFSQVLSERDLDWAQLGCAISHYKLANYVQALACCNVILERNPGSIEAYEWASRTYRAIGQNETAQKVLERAVQVLPTAPAIQSGLGNVASENCDWSVAITAFRNSVRFAKHSCHQSQQNYFGLARSLQTQISPQGGGGSSEAEREAVRTLEAVVEEYYDDDMIRFKSRLMTAETYKRSGDSQRANAAAKDAYDVFQSLDDSRKAEELDNLIEGVEGTRLESDVEQFKAEFNRRVYTETEWGRYNLKGMGLYRKGKFAEAYECFKKSLEHVENSPSVLLNLVQAGYELIKQDPARAAEVLGLCNERLLRMSIGAMNNKQQERYRKLNSRKAAASGSKAQ